MKPSPPKKPVPIFWLKAMSTFVPKAAHRKESFWQMRSPSIWAMSSGMIFPGYGAAKLNSFFAMSLVGEVGHE